MSKIVDVQIPNIGDYESVDVIEIFVKPGDPINKEDSLITLESEKATMEIPSPYQGTVKELKVAIGDKLSAGALILTMEVTSSAKATISSIKVMPRSPFRRVVIEPPRRRSRW